MWLVVFGIYRLTERSFKIIDVNAVMRLPLSMIHEGDLDLDEFKTRIPAKVVVEHRGHLVSIFPWWPAIQLLPVYLVLNIAGSWTDDEAIWRAQRRAAQAWMALTVVLMAVAVFRLYGKVTAGVMMVAFGFGSINWFVLSQVSFSNGLVQFWLVVAVLLVASDSEPSRWAATLCLVSVVVAVFYRLNLLPVAFCLMVYVVWRLRRAAVIPVIVAMLVVFAMAVANFYYLGNPIGMYGLDAGRMQLPSPDFLLALYANLLSPGRGLVVFSPWVLLAGLGLVLGRRELRLLHWLLFLGCLGHLVLTSNHFDWLGGGGSMGPRLTSDVLPLWTLLAAAGFSRLMSRPIILLLGAGTVAAGVTVAAGQVFSDSYLWNQRPVPATQARDRIFDWRDALVLDPFRSTPYEDRYPIHLMGPESDYRTNTNSLYFSWCDDIRDDVQYQVEILFRYLPRGRRSGQLMIETTDDKGVEIKASSLVEQLDRSKPLAWRVLARCSSGQIRATSSWRRLVWVDGSMP